MSLSKVHNRNRLINEFYCKFIYSTLDTELQIYSQSRLIQTIQRTGPGLYQLVFPFDIRNPPKVAAVAGDPYRLPIISVSGSSNADMCNINWFQADLYIALASYAITLNAGVMEAVAADDILIDVFGGWPLDSDVKRTIPA